MNNNLEIPKICLGGEDTRQFGFKCRDCGSRKVVYFISFPIGELFPPGAYCYKCLVKRCRVSRMIPFPIEEKLLNALKLDLGIKHTTPPRHIIQGGQIVR